MKLPLSMYPHSTAQNYQFRLTQFIARPQQLASWSRISQTFVKCEGSFPSRPANWPYLQPAEFSSPPSRHVPMWPSYLPTATLYQLSFCLQFLNEIPVYVSLLSSPLRCVSLISRHVRHLFSAKGWISVCRMSTVTLSDRGVQKRTKIVLQANKGCRNGRKLYCERIRAAETDKNCIASE